MDSDKTLSVSKLRREFPSKPPTRITQAPFDSGPKHLGTLAKLHPGERPRASDLWEYTQDLLYGGDIQDELLTYLLPFCLEAWRDDLLGVCTDYGGFVEHFYPVLANKHVFDVRLKPNQTAAVSHFMRESILQEIDSQRGLTYSGMGARPYRWIRALATYGVLLPDVDQLWRAWWSSETIGAAISIVQYASCLMYAQNENPVFAPWTPDAGGGPPSLWEFEGHLYEHHWLEPNVQFIRQNLNVRQVSDALNRAVEMLAAQSEYEIASEVRGDLPLCVEVLAARCTELPNLLETVAQPLEWPL